MQCLYVVYAGFHTGFFAGGGRSNCKGCSSVRIILNFKISGRGEMWLGGGNSRAPPPLYETLVCMYVSVCSVCM